MEQLQWICYKVVPRDPTCMDFRMSSIFIWCSDSWACRHSMVLTSFSLSRSSRSLLHSSFSRRSRPYRCFSRPQQSDPRCSARNTAISLSRCHSTSSKETSVSVCGGYDIIRRPFSVPLGRAGSLALSLHHPRPHSRALRQCGRPPRRPPRCPVPAARRGRRRARWARSCGAARRPDGCSPASPASPRTGPPLPRSWRSPRPNTLLRTTRIR
jgi:hypothetical protein